MNRNGHHDGRAQSIYGPAHDLITLNRLEGQVRNFLTSRWNAVNRVTDPRRDINDECGYPGYGKDTGRGTASLTPELYRDLFEREPIAARVVQLMPRESWQVTPLVYEDEDADLVTDFEERWDALGKQLRGEQCWYADEEGSPVWAALKQADEDSGIGCFGILLLGIDDGLPLDQPADGVVSATPAANARLFAVNGRQLALNVSLPGPERTTNRADQKFTGAPSYPTALDTGPDATPAPEYPSDTPSTTEHRLLFLRSFDETRVEVVSRETNPYHPRFGQPVMYRVALDDPRNQYPLTPGVPVGSVRVHWSRVIHLEDNNGVPRMRPVLNRLLDLRKVYGGDAEAYWRNVVMKLFFETHPALGGDVDIDMEAFKDQMERMGNGLQQWMALMGMSAKPVAPSVVDPTAHVAIQIEAICIQLDCPVPVFKGYEIGEQASTNNDSDWKKRVRGRQTGYLTPRVLVPFIDRCIAMGVLPVPGQGRTRTRQDVQNRLRPGWKVVRESPGGWLVGNATGQTKYVARGGYSIEWPDMFALNKKDKAAVALQITQALAAYVAGGVEAVMPLMDYLTRVIGFTEEEAQAIVDAAEKAQEEQQSEQQALADEHGYPPAPPPGFKEPPPPPEPSGAKPNGQVPAGVKA